MLMPNKHDSYIFLDFDGVLNTERWQRHCMAAGLPTEDGFGPVFDPEAVENLATIMEAVPGAKVIITSSWKWEGLEKMKRLWTKRKLPGVLLDIAPDFVPNFDDEAFEKILQGELPVGRGAEIRAWMEQNGAAGNHYVILDDLPDFYPDQQPHYIQTDPRVGITLEDAMRAIGILNGKLNG